MYTPKHFNLTDVNEINSIIDKNPFATVISSYNSEPMITHVPINRLNQNELYGHFAKSNPHSGVKNGSLITVIFTGDHAYISPRYYKSSFNVPTWNYSAVHCKGEINYIEDAEEAWSLFQHMVKTYEGNDGWKLPNEAKYKALVNAITFFKINVTEIKAKTKFNQNKSKEDIQSVINSLEENEETQTAQYMKKQTYND